jgi:hypothetical protein
MIGRPIKAFAVHGTGDYGDDAWFRKGKEFYEFARRNNIFLTGSLAYDEPFEWSGDVNGLPFGSSKQHRDWKAGGYSFSNFIEQYALIDRNLIIHSHALQLVAYSARRTDFNNIITIGSPIRNDMMADYKNLVIRCNKWKHIYDEKFDKMAFLGQFFDGKFFGSRRCDIIGVDNVAIKKINHSKILRNTKEMQMWIDNGWFEFLRS